MPVKLEAKVQARKARGRRYRRQLPKLTGSYRRAAVPCLRPEFNPEDFRMAREIVERYCPARVPAQMRKYLKGPIDLFDALLVYVLACEFGWKMEGMAPDLGRSRQVQRVWVSQIEDMRERYDFIEQICQRAQEYCRGFL